MLVLSRVTVRHFRTLLRRSVTAAAPRGPCPPVLAVADNEGVLLQAVQDNVGLVYRAASTDGSGQLAFPGELLARIESGADTPVTLELATSGEGHASWQEKGLPRTAEFVPIPEDQWPPRLDIPKRSVTLPPTFLNALDDACRTTLRQPPRYSLDHVQLQGKSGQIVATDGKQVLMQGGFRWLWAEDLLVPALPVFGARELADADEIRVGRAGDWVVVQAAPWSLHLKVDSEGRFPDVRTVIPSGANPTRLLLEETDAQSLMDRLPALPEEEDESPTVTLDLGEQTVLRARCDGKVTEMLLGASTVTGTPLRLCLDRKLLFRALRLGFREFEVHDPAKPLLARDGERLFVAVTIDPKHALAPSADSVPSAVVSTNGVDQPPAEREEAMTTPNHNNGRSAEPANPPDPLEEAEALKESLHASLNHLTRLIAGLRHFRKHHKAVSSVVASLRQLRLGP